MLSPRVPFPVWPYELNMASPLARGLVGWWPPGASRGRGTILRDLTRGGTSGTLTGTTWTVSPVVGPALAHDGTDAYVIVTDVGNRLDIGTGVISLAAWVRITGQQLETSGTRLGAIAGKGFLASGNGYGLYLSDELPRFGVRLGATNILATAAVSINDNRWHLLIGTFERSSATGVKLYVDGVPQTPADSTPLGANDLSNAINFTIGTRESGAAYAFDLLGDTGPVAVWNRTLAPADVLALWQPATRWQLCRAWRRQWFYAEATAEPDLGVAIVWDDLTHWVQGVKVAG